MPQPIAVTGATGQVGRRVASLLHARGLPLRLVVRDPLRLAPELAAIADVERASGYGHLDEMRAAFTGAGTVFLVPAAESADRVAQHRTAVQAAAEAKVQRVVYLSFINASEDATFTLARDHWHTEQAIRSSGLAFAFLRMSLYMDFMPMMVGADGAIRGPAGEGRLAAILRDDVAAACAAVLASPEAHDGKTYDLTGREALSMSEAAAMLSTHDKPVRYVDESDDEAWASRQRYGAPEWEVRGWISSYQAVRDGSLHTVSGDVAELTGREPKTLREHLAAGGSVT